MKLKSDHVKSWPYSHGLLTVVFVDFVITSEVGTTTCTSRLTLHVPLLFTIAFDFPNTMRQYNSASQFASLCSPLACSASTTEAGHE